MKNGRKYFLDDKSYSPYPLPCDVKELSRQTLWHELSRELWGGYSTINWDTEKLPDRVLDLGCGTGIWSAAMNEDFIKRGKKGTEFVGMDLMEGNQMDMRDVNWKFVKHNFLETPFPFEAETFDFVFMRDIMLTYPSKDMYSGIISEVLRIIKPGGLFEIQCNDYIIRTLSRPSTPSYLPGTSSYEITSTTQFLSVPENPFISTYNTLITSALVKRDLPPVPCTLVKASFLTEDGVSILSQRRFALPFDQIWWESTTAPSSSSTGGGDGNSDADSKASKRRSTSGSSLALRHLVRLMFVQLIEALEPVLRDAEGMEVDEWDSWYRELMWNWFEGGGLRGGECMEFGAWYGKKKAK
ncbi:S-adenosyl-L-methionine-dependent methyltransferase [Pyronema domesticum]|nr:S-adenosyl-L-methionine-dependent methyltransferase [Pyronema domesticum]